MGARQNRRLDVKLSAQALRGGDRAAGWVLNGKGGDMGEGDKSAGLY